MNTRGSRKLDPAGVWCIQSPSVFCIVLKVQVRRGEYMQLEKNNNNLKLNGALYM